MHTSARRAVPFIGIVTLAFAVPAHGQHTGHSPDSAAHGMWGAGLGGWHLMGMAQAYPVVTIGAPGSSGSPLRETEAYLTQPVVMADLASPGARIVLRTTLDFEGITQPDGELTFGGWGEGFIDRRHPHTLLHELMLSVNFPEAAGGSFSVSAGKGFAPYGSDDPMSRPGLKYPTNHHLSQILERWTLNAAFLRSGWSIEAGVFGGAEPEGPYDLGGLDTFGDSWSVRLAKRWEPGSGPSAAWEASLSHGSVAEAHHGEGIRTRLWNATLRHERAGLYALIEASRAESNHDDENWFSVLAETRITAGRHRPYARIEVATRPEYVREGPAGTDGFFRYDHDAHAIGATAWTIGTLAYAYELTRLPLSARPFIEVQHHRARAERGPVEPALLFGTDSFWSVSLGARVFLGGGPMRMGAYGVLDPMTTMPRPGDAAAATSRAH